MKLYRKNCTINAYKCTRERDNLSCTRNNDSSTQQLLLIYSGCLSNSDIILQRLLYFCYPCSTAHFSLWLCIIYSCCLTSTFFLERHWKCLISDSYKKIIDGTIEEQLDTRRHKENKITPKSSLVVFFIRLFVVHQNLKNTMKKQ